MLVATIERLRKLREHPAVDVKCGAGEKFPVGGIVAYPERRYRNLPQQRGEFVAYMLARFQVERSERLIKQQGGGF
jgi:hypothetical protein